MFRARLADFKRVRYLFLNQAVGRGDQPPSLATLARACVGKQATHTRVYKYAPNLLYLKGLWADRPNRRVYEDVHIIGYRPGYTEGREAMARVIRPRH